MFDSKSVTKITNMLDLALEMLCTFLYEEDDTKIDKKSYELIEEIGNILNMNSKTWQILESRITNSDS